jgi:hypothetical protein
MTWKNKTLTWAEVHWPRPLNTEAVLSLLTHLATIDRHCQMMFEVRARRGRIHYLLGAEAGLLKRIKQVVHGELAGVRFNNQVTRADMVAAKSVKLSRPQLALNVNNQTAIIRSVLAALAQAKHGNDETVLQIILGQSFTPSLLPNRLIDPAASWLDILRGSVAPTSSESRSLMKDKIAHHGFAVCMRIGSVAFGADHKPSLPKAVSHIRSVFSALKVAESVGVRLRAVVNKPQNLNLAKRPCFYPMRLSIKELVGLLAWPLGEEELSGVAGLHPRLLLAPAWYEGENRCFALASGLSDGRLHLGISAKDSLEHTILLGPTGAGKSTAMLNLILADIRSGRSVLVIDPKADLVNDILVRIPEFRLDDVVVLDPTDAVPVGFNPLADKTHNPSLVADGVLAVFRDVFADSWGVRTQDILSAALLTLVRYGQKHGGKVSLVWLPALLTDANFRHKIVSKAASADPLGLGAFWAGFKALSIAERNQHIAPVMNKLRQFLLRPQLRAVLGQTEPKFSLRDLFGKRRIVLVPLNKGIIGSEAARLLGSLIVGQLWTLALGRANLSPERRHIVSVFIDEVQDYLSLPTDLADALSQARGLGVGLTLAHQYRAQLPVSLRAGIDANARNKIVFGLNAGDAKDMAAMATGEKLEALDFQLLPRFGVYVSLQQHGKATGWLSGSTLPAPPATTSATEVKAKSQARYGQSAEAVEREFLDLMGHGKSSSSKGANVPIGRKKRSGDEY